MRGLDLAAARAELALAAAVDRDAVLGAIVVAVEEALDAAEARRLEVERLWCERSAAMSATEWIGASQVIRSRCGSRIGSRLGRSGPDPRSTRGEARRPPSRTARGRPAWSTGVPL